MRQLLILYKQDNIKTIMIHLALQSGVDGAGSSAKEEPDIDEDLLEALDFIAKHLPLNNMLPLSRKLGIKQTSMEEFRERYMLCDRTFVSTYAWWRAFKSIAFIL